MNLLHKIYELYTDWQVKVGLRCVCGSTRTEPWGWKISTCVDCGRRRP